MNISRLVLNFLDHLIENISRWLQNADISIWSTPNFKRVNINNEIVKFFYGNDKIIKFAQYLKFNEDHILEESVQKFIQSLQKKKKIPQQFSN